MSEIDALKLRVAELEDIERALMWFIHDDISRWFWICEDCENVFETATSDDPPLCECDSGKVVRMSLANIVKRYRQNLEAKD